jgi:hypothetical protein
VHTSPTARSFPSGLSDTLVDAFIRSLEFNARELAVSVLSPFKYAGDAAPALIAFEAVKVRALASEFATGVEGW